MPCLPRLLPAAAVLAAVEQANAVQSVHAPASAAAESVHALGLAMYVAAGVIALVVIVLVLRAILGRARTAHGGLFVLAGGVVFPVIVLSLLLVTALLIDNRLSRPLASPVARIEVIGHQWWWEVRYLPPEHPGAGLQRLSKSPERASSGRPAQASGPQAIVMANEIHIPVGHPVEIAVRTHDVIHSLWVPALGGKVDMIPGRVNRLAWQAERAGVYRGQCAEFCGGPHGLMGLWVVAEPAADYRAWLEHQATAARKPSEPALAQGQRLFLTRGCAECHAIRGTPARGSTAPDLTHVGSRLTIAAATIENRPDMLVGWIANPNRIKPGHCRADGSALSGPQQRALAAYLVSLE